MEISHAGNTGAERIPYGLPKYAALPLLEGAAVFICFQCINCSPATSRGKYLTLTSRLRYIM